MNAYLPDEYFKCELCNCDLDPVDEKWILKHPDDEGCEHDGKRFHHPRVELLSAGGEFKDNRDLVETSKEPPPKQTISQSPVRPEPGIKPHFWRHLLSGTVVFLLGVIVTEGLAYIRERAERKVKWVGGELGSFRPWADDIITNVQNVQMGVAQDGRIVWREKK